MSPAPYIVKEDLYETPVEVSAVLEAAGEVLTLLVAGAAAATVGTVEELTTGATGAEDAGSLATGAAADGEIDVHVHVAGVAAATVGTVEATATGAAGAEDAGTLATSAAADEGT